MYYNIQRHFKNRINLNYAGISKQSYDIKYVYRASTGHRFIFMIADELTNYLVTNVPNEVEELILCAICKHAPFILNI